MVTVKTRVSRWSVMDTSPLLCFLTNMEASISLLHARKYCLWHQKLVFIFHFPSDGNGLLRDPPAPVVPTRSFDPSEAGSLGDTDWCPSLYPDKGQGPSQFPGSNLPL